MNVLTILGACSEAIELPPVVKELERYMGPGSRICVTGQHRELLHQTVDVFDIEPDFGLNIMRNGQSLWEGSTCTGCIRSGRAKGYRHRL